MQSSLAINLHRRVDRRLVAVLVDQELGGAVDVEGVNDRMLCL